MGGDLDGRGRDHPRSDTPLRLSLGPRGPPRELALSYQRRFFRRLAWANAAVLIGFIVGITTATWWIHPVMAVASGLGSCVRCRADAASQPTQAKLTERRRRLDLLDALLELPSERDR